MKNLLSIFRNSHPFYLNLNISPLPLSFPSKTKTIHIKSMESREKLGLFSPIMTGLSGFPHFLSTLAKPNTVILSILLRYRQSSDPQCPAG